MFKTSYCDVSLTTVKSMFKFRFWVQLCANIILDKAFVAVGCGQSGEKNNVGQDNICLKCAEV